MEIKKISRKPPTYSKISQSKIMQQKASLEGGDPILPFHTEKEKLGT